MSFEGFEPACWEFLTPCSLAKLVVNSILLTINTATSAKTAVKARFAVARLEFFPTTMHVKTIAEKITSGFEPRT